MKPDTKEILDFRIYPAIFDQLPEHFPEFEFRRTSEGWQSGNTLKVDGTTGDSRGKVYCYENRPWNLRDYRVGNVSIWTYVRNRDGLNKQETLKRLADMAGVDLPKGELDREAIKRIRQSEKRGEMWETANDFFISSLNTPAAAGCREYLKNTRKYTPATIEKMGCGFIPSQAALFQHLQKKGFTPEEINSNIKLFWPIGESHQMTIPYRGSAGKMRGAAFRNINYQEGDKFGKYLYNSNIGKESVKNDFLFNIENVAQGTEITTFEGLLDARHATARGFKNITALGGTDFTESIITGLLRRGIRHITLGLDNDKEGIRATKRAINNLISYDFRIYVMQYPDGIKDADQLLREQGAEALAEAIEAAVPFYIFLLNCLITEYNLSSMKDLDRLADAAFEISQHIRKSTDIDIFCGTIEKVTNGLITREGFKERDEYLKDKRHRERQGELITRKLNEVRRLQKEGDPLKALESYKTGIEEIKKSNVRDLLPPFYSYADFKMEMEATPPALKTGYDKIDEVVRIPRGAVSIIAGRPSHGKTTFMMNLLLRMSKGYAYKKFYFFSYEESKKAIYSKLLNIFMDPVNLKEHKGIPAGITNLHILREYMRQGLTGHTVIENAKSKLQNLFASGRVVIVDQKFPVEDLTAVIEHLSEAGDMGAVFVDYLQRIPTEKKTPDERMKINHVMGTISKTAVKLDIPIIMGAQLNRAAAATSKSRQADPDKQPHPTLEHLKESGAIEEDANAVLVVWNPYREPGFETSADGVDIKVLVLKNRDGITNKEIPLTFNRPQLTIT